VSTTTVASGLTVQQWEDKFYVESIASNRFKGEMGTDESSIIQVKEDLSNKKGKWITFALANRLKGAAKTNGQTLVNNEETLYTRSQMVAVGLRRNGVVFEDVDDQYSAVSLLDAAKAGLKQWSNEDVEGMIIGALGAVFSDNNSQFYYTDAGATETVKDAWLSNNLDRILFGADLANRSGTDHSASLANINNTDDLATPAMLSKMKRMAKAADPRIRPIRSESNGRDMYIVYMGSRGFRDLRNNTAIQQAQREVSLQMENERLFKGGDLLWDNMIIKEIEHIPVYEDVGSGGTVDVEPVYLCGAQCLGWAWSSRYAYRKRAEDDYGELKGNAIRAIYGVEKLAFGTALSATSERNNPKQHGLVTGYVAAPADA
jgi:N4-gp56 family major capsid protein